MADVLSGFAFPFRIDPVTGNAMRASGADKVRHNLVQLLLTDIGERVMRRAYGGGLRQIVHDPNNDALRAIVQHQLAKAVQEWEPHAQLQEVTVVQQPEDGLLWVEISYIARPNLLPTSVRVPLQVGGL